MAATLALLFAIGLGRAGAGGRGGATPRQQKSGPTRSPQMCKRVSGRACGGLPWDCPGECPLLHTAMKGSGLGEASSGQARASSRKHLLACLRPISGSSRWPPLRFFFPQDRRHPTPSHRAQAQFVRSQLELGGRPAPNRVREHVSQDRSCACDQLAGTEPARRRAPCFRNGRGPPFPSPPGLLRAPSCAHLLSGPSPSASSVARIAAFPSSSLVT